MAAGAVPSSVSPPYTFTGSQDAFRTKLKRLMGAARVSNPRDNPVYSGVTVTTPATANADSTVPNQFFCPTSNGPAAAAMSYFSFTGGTPAQWVSQPYLVFPVSSVAPSTAGNMSNAFGTASPMNAWCWQAEFMTDAATVEISFGSSLSTNLQIVVDGQYVSATSIVPNTYSSPTLNTIRLAFAARRPGGRRIQFRHRGTGGFKGIAIGALDRVWKPDTSDSLIVASTGDSYSEAQGLGLTTGTQVAFAADGAWNNWLCDLMGWSDCRQVAVGSTGYVVNNNIRSTVINQIPNWGIVPDIILSFGGYNDEGLLFGGASFTATASAGVMTVTATGAGSIVSGMTLNGGAATVLPLGTGGTTGTGLTGTYAITGTIAGGTTTGVITAALIAAAALAAWQAMRAAYPKALIFVGGLWAGAKNQRATTLATEAAVAAAFASWGDSNAYYIPINADLPPWTTGTGNSNATNGTGNSDLYIASDATHPNDAGHQHHARRAALAIRRVVEGM